MKVRDSCPAIHLTRTNYARQQLNQRGSVLPGTQIEALVSKSFLNVKYVIEVIQQVSVYKWLVGYAEWKQFIFIWQSPVAFLFFDS